MRVFVDVLFVGAFLAVGTLSILRPMTLIRWAKAAHPRINESDVANVAIARIVGAGILLFGLVLGVIVSRSFGNSGT